MQPQTWVTMDKADWGPGPWQDEPDKEQWQDEKTGLPCLIKRNQFGNLCGYVGVPKSHPWHGQGYWPDSDWVDGKQTPLPRHLQLLQDVMVHGGLTYSGSCQEGPEGETICHVPGAGESDDVWWLGFDCGHWRDFSPAMAAREKKLGMTLQPFDEETTYKTVAYVKEECRMLAEQAAAAA